MILFEDFVLIITDFTKSYQYMNVLIYIYIIALKSILLEILDTYTSIL